MGSREKRRMRGRSRGGSRCSFLALREVHPGNGSREKCRMRHCPVSIGAVPRQPRLGSGLCLGSQKEAAENPHLSDKTDLAPSEDSQSLSKTEPLEKVLNEMSEEIVNLLSKYAHLVSTRAALDSSHVRELDEILKEARAIENHLKQKREMLKQRFTFLANTLQS
uniref:Testis expressed 12 n=1 Tax=Ficedula albicollis TaxID=59894 RepID=A0A803VI82_FICAL